MMEFNLNSFAQLDARIEYARLHGASNRRNMYFDRQMMTTMPNDEKFNYIHIHMYNIGILMQHVIISSMSE